MKFLFVGQKPKEKKEKINKNTLEKQKPKEKKENNLKFFSN